MTLEKSGGGVHGRRPSLRGITYARIHRGQEVQSNWPKKRGKKLHPNTKEQNEFFRQVQWAFKYSPASIQRDFVDAVAGTPLMPRDLYLMAISGRLAMLNMPNGTKVYSMAAINNVSDTLDFLAQFPGSMLFRTNEGWVGIQPPTAADQALISMGPDGILPEWRDAGAGGGAVVEIDRAEPVGVNDVTFAGIPQIYSDLQLVIVGRSDLVATQDGVGIEANGAVGNIYNIARQTSQGTSTSSAISVSTNHFLVGASDWPAANAEAGEFGAVEATIYDYASTDKMKHMLALKSRRTANLANDHMHHRVSGVRKALDAITSLRVYLGTGNWVAGSRISLYGRR